MALRIWMLPAPDGSITSRDKTTILTGFDSASLIGQYIQKIINFFSVITKSKTINSVVTKAFTFYSEL